MKNSVFHKFFSKPQPVRVTFSGPGGSETVDGQVFHFEAPYFDLALEALPEVVSDLQVGSECVVRCIIGNSVYGISSAIEEVLVGGFRMKMVQVDQEAQKRRFFRIDADVSLRIWPGEKDEADCEALEQKVNLSAVGLRFNSRQKFERGQLLSLEMELPGDPPEQVNCIGAVVRFDGGDHGHYSVAIDFRDMGSEDQEKVIRFCLSEQLRQLRMKVKIKGRQ